MIRAVTTSPTVTRFLICSRDMGFQRLKRSIAPLNVSRKVTSSPYCMRRGDYERFHHGSQAEIWREIHVVKQYKYTWFDRTNPRKGSSEARSMLTMETVSTMALTSMPGASALNVSLLPRATASTTDLRCARSVTV